VGSAADRCSFSIKLKAALAARRVKILFCGDGTCRARWRENRRSQADPKSKIQNPKSRIQQRTPTANGKRIRPPQFQIPPIAELEGEIEALLNSDLKKSQLQLKISELAQKFRMNSADVWKIYRERELELEQEASQEDTRIGIEQLLASQAASVKLSEIFPNLWPPPSKK
jgi:hypothetical protein